MKDTEEIKGMKRQADALREIISMQREELDTLRKGVAELSQGMDSVLAALAERYGEAETEQGEVLGWRLLCPMEIVTKAMMEHTKVQCRRDEESHMYVIGVVRGQSD